MQDGPSIHDCMITKNYVIILDLPVTFSMKTLLAGHPFPYAWNPAHKARIGLLPKEGGNDEVIWCDVEPCYVFHPCNAYETEDGKVIMDVCAHDTHVCRKHEGPRFRAKCRSNAGPSTRVRAEHTAQRHRRTTARNSPAQTRR